MYKKLIIIFISCVLIFSLSLQAIAASSESLESANKLNILSLFDGTGTDSSGAPIYELDKAPTRAEALVMLIRLMGKEDEALNNTWRHPFTDVPSWVEHYVGYAYQNSITSGTSASTFGSNDIASSNQYLTFVLCALGYSSTNDFQWDKAYYLANAIGLTHGEYNSTTTFLRADVASISFDALSIHGKNQTTPLISRLCDDGAVTKESVAKVGLSGLIPVSNVGTGAGSVTGTGTGGGTVPNAALIAEAERDLANLEAQLSLYQQNLNAANADLAREEAGVLARNSLGTWLPVINAEAVAAAQEQVTYYQNLVNQYVSLCAAQREYIAKLKA